LSAQRPQNEISLHVGAGPSWLRGNRAIDYTDPLFGPAAEVGFHYAITPAFGLRIGAGYQTKGSRTQVLLINPLGEQVASGFVDQSLDYITIPVMARYGFGERIRFTAGGGFYAGLLTRARTVHAGQLRSPAQDIADDLEPLDAGLCASLEFAFRLSDRLRITAETRYGKGLTNISALPLVDDGSIRTNAACLLIGLGYRLGGPR